MKLILLGGASALALALVMAAPAAAATAVATPADTSQCATVTVTRTTDIAALQRDADCFGAAAAADRVARDVLSKAASSATASQKYRLDRIADLTRPQPSVFTPSAVIAPTLNGLANIASEFDPMTTLVKGTVPGSNLPDFGAFRFQCTVSHTRADDPIVYPGQPGKSHLHQFFGNTGTDAYSNYESLRATGKSTCQDATANPANRSAYWVPALLDGKGNIIQPDGITIYYKRWPETDFHCNAQGGYPTRFNVEGSACADIPNGLRYIFGFNMLNPGQAPSGSVQFICAQDPASFETMSQALARCRAKAAGGKTTNLLARIEAPNCWDGKTLDSADHRGHVAYASYGEWGYLKCPTDHPIVIPTYTQTLGYTILPGDDTSKWLYASDAMMGAVQGTTFHADVYQAWDPVVRAMWHANCINKDLNCESGQVGNGYGIKGADAARYLLSDGTVVTPADGANPNRLVPIASVPKTPVK